MLTHGGVNLRFPARSRKATAGSTTLIVERLRRGARVRCRATATPISGPRHCSVAERVYRIRATRPCGRELVRARAPLRAKLVRSGHVPAGNGGRSDVFHGCGVRLRGGLRRGSHTLWRRLAAGVRRGGLDATPSALLRARCLDLVV